MDTLKTMSYLNVRTMSEYSLVHAFYTATYTESHAELNTWCAQNVTALHIPFYKDPSPPTHISLCP